METMYIYAGNTHYFLVYSPRPIDGKKDHGCYEWMEFHAPATIGEIYSFR